MISVNCNSVKSKYYLNDISRIYGTFIKIIKDYVFNKKKINSGDSIGINNVRIAFNIMADKTIKLIWKIGEEKEDEKSFDVSSSPILVGRSEKSSVFIKSNALSRTHFSIAFTENEWFIRDGNGSKPSTNGSWLLINTETELENSMIFKASETEFLVKLT